MDCTQYTLAQYNTLNEAIALGATKVVYGDKTVEYRSLDEMLRLQIAMKSCLFPKNNTNNSRRFVNFSKGTNSGRRRY